MHKVHKAYRGHGFLAGAAALAVFAAVALGGSSAGAEIGKPFWTEGD